MILAAARFGERRQGASPPKILSTAFACRQWGVSAVFELPVPRWALAQMTASLNVYEAFRAYADKPLTLDDIQWSERYPGYWKLLMNVEHLKCSERLKHPTLGPSPSTDRETRRLDGHRKNYHRHRGAG